MFIETENSNKKIKKTEKEKYGQKEAFKFFYHCSVQFVKITSVKFIEYNKV